MIRFITVAGMLAVSQSALPQMKIDAVVESAAFQRGLPNNGAVATVFCSGLTQPVVGTFVAPPTGGLPLELAGVSVSVNFARAPILAVVGTIIGQTAYMQVNFQVPQERYVSLVFVEGGQKWLPGRLAVSTRLDVAVLEPLPDPSRFGAFFSAANGFAIARHASDHRMVTLEDPARPGETIIAYGNDFFGVWPPPPVGFPAPNLPLFEFSPGSYVRGSGELFLRTYEAGSDLGPRPPPSRGWQPLKLLFQGLAPGLTGVQQINFEVPADQQTGEWALFFNQTTPRAHISGPFVKLPVRADN